METKGIEQMLSQLRAVADVASGKPADTASAAGGVDFAAAAGAAVWLDLQHPTLIDQQVCVSRRPLGAVEQTAVANDQINIHDVAPGK